MQNLYYELIELLEQDASLIIYHNGKAILNKALIIDRALKLDVSLLKILLSHENIKKQFFAEVDDIKVFDKVAFQRFVNTKNFLPDSFTQFNNKIGLANEEYRYIADSREVVLVWPHKDCVLEGGQTKEDAKRNEIFYNTTLAPDEIDVLTAPKVLTKWKRFDQNGETQPATITKSDNLIIKGNNLLALHSLKEIYAGQVKLIYIDPPFNTGNDSFKYNDSFNHSTWLTFMKNRLEIAKEILSNSGTIVISIDQKELFYLQILCDEIFGYENRRNIITVKRSSVSGAKVINPGVVNVSEYLVIYSKNTSYWMPNKVFRKKDRDERYNSYIINKEDKPENWQFCSVLDAWSNSLQIEKSKLKKYFKDDHDTKLEEFCFNNADKIFQFVTLDDNAVSDAVVELKKISKNDDNKVYILERENKLNYYIYKGKALLFLGNRMLEIDGEKVFGELITDIWDDVLPNDLHNEGGISLKKGKKPEKLLQRILQLTTNERDIVLDFFAGSGTAGAVAHKMNRRYILVEQMDYIHELPEARLKNVIAGEQSGISKAMKWKGGGSFIYAELKNSNQTFIDNIQKCTSTQELLSVWNDIQKTAFISYKILPENINKEIREFEKLTFEEQQRFLIETLDHNMLYVNYSEIEDKTHQVSDYDIEMNQKFYFNC